MYILIILYGVFRIDIWVLAHYYRRPIPRYLTIYIYI